MVYSGQVLHSIEVRRLKGISELEPLALDQTALTAITGTNGCGKSTILHALACVYGPSPLHARVDFKFPQFFLPTSDASWQGSEFKVKHTYRFGPDIVDNVNALYGKANDRWTPRYERRPQRYVDYIGVDTCVPSIERERGMSFLELTAAPAGNNALTRSVMEAASVILNRPYEALSVKSGRTRRYRAVEQGGLGYSSLSMGAGEQRVFEIVERIYKAPNNSLVLIDEIDLLMHEDALRRLISVVDARAREKSIQVVFTTHRESLLQRKELTVHHLFSANGKTMAMPAAHPDVWERLTGDSRRPIEVFVEDDLAQAVVHKICSDLGIRRHVKTVIVGAAQNLFTLAGGLALRGEGFGNQLVVLDGDVYRTDVERRQQVQRVVTGHGSAVEAIRLRVLDSVTMLSLPGQVGPEGHIHAMLRSLPPDDGGEIAAIARQIVVPMDRHDFINEVVARLGEVRAVGLCKVIDVAAQSEAWSDYTAPVAAGLERRARQSGLLPSA